MNDYSDITASAWSGLLFQGKFLKKSRQHEVKLGGLAAVKLRFAHEDDHDWQNFQGLSDFIINSDLKTLKISQALNRGNQSDANVLVGLMAQVTDCLLCFFNPSDYAIITSLEKLISDKNWNRSRIFPYYRKRKSVKFKCEWNGHSQTSGEACIQNLAQLKQDLTLRLYMKLFLRLFKPEFTFKGICKSYLNSSTP